MKQATQKIQNLALILIILLGIILPRFKFGWQKAD